MIEQIERTVTTKAGEQSRQPVPPVEEPSSDVATAASGKASWTELFRGIYGKRTLIVWGLWICTYFVTYGITTWLPTIYRTFFKLSVSDALWYGVVTNLAGVAGALVCALAVDRFGRRPWFLTAFALGSAPLFVLWWLRAKTPAEVVMLASISFAFNASNSLLVYLYTPEIYPTRFRTLGTGAASAWLRIASAAGPTVVGLTLAGYGVSGVFLLFGMITLAGVAVALGVVETREQMLEEISPKGLPGRLLEHALPHGRGSVSRCKRGARILSREREQSVSRKHGRSTSVMPS